MLDRHPHPLTSGGSSSGQSQSGRSGPHCTSGTRIVSKAVPRTPVRPAPASGQINEFLAYEPRESTALGVGIRRPSPEHVGPVAPGGPDAPPGENRSRLTLVARRTPRSGRATERTARRCLPGRIRTRETRFRLNVLCQTRDKRGSKPRAVRVRRCHVGRGRRSRGSPRKVRSRADPLRPSDGRRISCTGWRSSTAMVVSRSSVCVHASRPAQALRERRAPAADVPGRRTRSRRRERPARSRCVHARRANGLRG